jgi:hypothetical protein
MTRRPERCRRPVAIVHALRSAREETAAERAQAAFELFRGAEDAPKPTLLTDHLRRLASNAGG